MEPGKPGFLHRPIEIHTLMASSEIRAEELDLSVSNMGSPALGQQVLEIIEDLPGIKGVRVVERGVWVKYNPQGITPDKIIAALRQAGFHAAIFQDSASGKTGVASF